MKGGRRRKRGQTMKKNIAIVVLAILSLILLQFTGQLYQDTRVYKSEIASYYERLVKDTRRLVSRINNINMEEATKTEDGKKLLNNYREQILNSSFRFMNLQNELYIIGEMLYDIGQLLHEAAEDSVSAKEVEEFEKQLEMVTLIIIDLQNHPDFPSYELFTESNHELNEKIEQRLTEE